MGKLNKRLLNCQASDFAKMDREDLVDAIRASEGRTIVSEVNAIESPAMDVVTNAEIAKASGADMILFNCLDLNDIWIEHLPETDEPIKYVKKLCGIPVGLNLEPVDFNVEMGENRLEIVEGRQGTKENFKKAQEVGFDFICLTGNPGVGVSNKTISESIKVARENFDGMIIAGKMHGAGAKEDIFSIEQIDSFIDNGADVILLPAAGTVPGVTLEKLEKAISHVKSRGKLALATNGTSQESSDIETIKRIAIMSKMAGADMHHIGDAGGSGMAPYENIYNLSLAVRGLRHTIKRMATSVLR